MANDGNVDLGDLSGQETPFLLEGSLEPALSLPLFAVAATGQTGAALEGYGPGLALPAFTLPDAGMADGMTLAPFALAAVGEAGSAITGRLALLAPQLAGSLEPALDLPGLALAATGSSGQLLAAQLLTLPAPQVAASGAGSAGLTLAAFDASGVLQAGTVADGAINLSTLTLAASSRQDTIAAGMVTLSLLQLGAEAGADALVDGSITLDAFALAASAGTGQLAEAFLTVPLFQVGASGFMDVVGNATLTLPAFVVDSASIHLPRPRASAIVLNTRLKGVVRYEGLAANSFATFAGLQLAATDDGIVALMGETDFGAPIAASVSSGTSDLGAPQRKRIEAAYVGYRAQGEMEMTLVTDEHHEYTYRLVPRQIADAIHSTRVKFGRGVDGHYWQWTLANTNGGGFDLASLQLNVVPLDRSV